METATDGAAAAAAAATVLLVARHQSGRLSCMGMPALGQRLLDVARRFPSHAALAVPIFTVMQFVVIEGGACCLSLSRASIRVA
jgi:hypothetical protein